MFRSYDWHNDIPDRSVSIIVDGVSGSGKTYLINKVIPLLDRKKNYSKILLISSTSHLSGDFKQIPKKHQYKAKNINEVIKNLIEVQMRFIKQNKRPKVLLILDDVIGTTGSSLRHNSLLERAFTNFRHLNICIILILQDISKARPSLRLNATHIIMFKNNNYNKKRYIIENFLTIDGNKKEGYKLLNNIWDRPYKSLIINQWNIQRSDSLFDYVFYYIA
jgi:hypothetical protein